MWVCFKQKMEANQIMPDYWIFFSSLSKSNHAVTSTLRSLTGFNADHLLLFEIGITGVKIDVTPTSFIVSIIAVCWLYRYYLRYLLSKNPYKNLKIVDF